MTPCALYYVRAEKRLQNTLITFDWNTLSRRGFHHWTQRAEAPTISKIGVVREWNLPNSVGPVHYHAGFQAFNTLAVEARKECHSAERVSCHMTRS